MTHHKHLIETHPLGPTVASHLVAEWQLRQARLAHHPMPLMVAIQFWKGDKYHALRLARFLADIEPEFRLDTIIALAARYDVEIDKEIQKTYDYVSHKFPVTLMRSNRQATGHPDGCFGVWAGTAENSYSRLLSGWPVANVMFVEPDGVPARFDWADAAKRAHAANLLCGKRITGARMDGAFYEPHVNGTMLMHLSAWGDHPSWRSCVKDLAWDCYHGQSMLGELGPVPTILNLYGAQDLSLSVYKTIGANYSWIASVKDESAWECAQSLVGKKWDELSRSVGGHKQRQLPAIPSDGPNPNLKAPRRARPVTDLFMITYPRDYPWLRYFFRSIEKFARGKFRHLVLVIEEQDKPPAKLPHYVVLKRCRNYRKTDIAGYVGQAVECLRAYQYTDADVIWFSEADTPFISPMAKYPTRKPPLVYLPWNRLGPKASGLGDPGAIIWQERTGRLVGIPAKVHTTIWPPFVYPRCVVEKAWKMVGGEEPLRTFARKDGSINQHDILGTVALKFFAHKVHAINGDTERKLIPSNVVKHYWMKRDPADPEIHKQLKKDGVI